MALQREKKIYMQIMDKIILEIVTGTLLPGQKLKSVRKYASEFEINTNTMQRVLYELERMDLIINRHNIGRFVTSDKELIKRVKENMVQRGVHIYRHKMFRLGYSEEEAKAFFIKCWTQKDEDSEE